MGEPLCTRVGDTDRERWDKLCFAIKNRNSLAKQSDILRDVVFGSHNIVTENDRKFLLSGDPILLQGDDNSEQVMVSVHRANEIGNDPNGRKKVSGQK